ncbi:MAG: hypothetical protein ABL958_00395 [Bdellovibrionia bacterium]
MNVMYFPNLLPSHDDRPVCSNMMSRIDDLAPSDSKTNAIVNLLADGTYHTVIAISALCGQFKTEAKAKSFVSSLTEAQHGMLRTLAEWKQKRRLK